MIYRFFTPRILYFKRMFPHFFIYKISLDRNLTKVWKKRQLLIKYSMTMRIIPPRTFRWQLRRVRVLCQSICSFSDTTLKHLCIDKSFQISPKLSSKCSKCVYIYNLNSYCYSLDSVLKCQHLSYWFSYNGLISFPNQVHVKIVCILHW